jgi:excisionase family DNA binding protein
MPEIATDSSAGAQVQTGSDLTLTIEQAAGILRVSTQTVYAGVRNGSIPAIRVARRWRVLRRPLERMLGAA